MKRFLATITATIAIAMTSCLKEFSPDAGLAGGSPHILSINAEFAPFEGNCEVPKSTVKGAITPSMYDTISVFGYSYTTEIGKANICCNETMTGDGSTFSPETDIPLPESEGNIYLWGIAPVNANGITLPASSASGTPSFTYSMPDLNSKMQDIVVGTSGPHSSLTGVPEMMFNHIMSAIRLDLSNVKGNFSISEVKLKNIYTTARYTPGTGWSEYADKQDRSVYVTANISESDNGQTLVGGENLFIIPPGAINGDTELVILTAGGEYSCSLSNVSLTAGQIKKIGIQIGEQGGGGDEDVQLSEFTINEDGDKVVFSPGNLYWDGSEFKFEEHQYDYPTSWDPNHVGHFYWAQDAAYAIAQPFYHTVASANDIFFAADGGAIKGYTVLSENEWQYLIDNNIGKFKVTIDGKNCTVLAPDGFDGTIKDSYTAAEWAKIESASGLVALPFAASRALSSIKTGGSNGFYWSVAWTDSLSYYTQFTSSNASVKYVKRSAGMSVRLVKKV